MLNIVWFYHVSVKQKQTVLKTQHQQSHFSLHMSKMILYQAYKLSESKINVRFILNFGLGRINYVSFIILKIVIL